MKFDEMLKKEIEEDMDKVKAPGSLLKFAENIKEESLQMNSKSESVKVTPLFNKKNGKKKFSFVATAMLGFGILTVSAFTNPTMAEMASNIPYLGHVFKQEPIFQLITDALEKEGFEEFALGETPGDVVNYDVLIKGTEEDANRARDKVTGILEDILQSRGYDNYTITVGAYMPQYTELSKEEKKLGEFGELLTSELKAQGFNIIGVNPYNSEIEVSIPLSETRVDEIKNATLEFAKANGTNKEAIMDIVDVEANDRENLWMDYLSAIHDGLAGKKEYKVSGYGYSYKNQELKMYIKTSINPNDADAKETVEKIHKEVEAFLSSDEVKNSIIGNESYKLYITDKKGNEFNF